MMVIDVCLLIHYVRVVMAIMVGVCLVIRGIIWLMGIVLLGRGMLIVRILSIMYAMSVIAITI